MHTLRFFLLLAVLGAAAPMRAAQWDSAEIHVTVTGTSTLHDWSVESRTATGGFVAPAAGGTSATGELRIPAKSLAGTQGGLNDRMYKALKAEAHPTIVFELVELVVPADAVDATPWPVRGRLTLAGTTRELTLAPTATALADGRLRLEVTTDLRMTDHGIKPPTFMGMVKTGDVVKIRIQWTLQPAPPVNGGTSG